MCRNSKAYIITPSVHESIDFYITFFSPAVYNNINEFHLHADRGSNLMDGLVNYKILKFLLKLFYYLLIKSFQATVANNSDSVSLTD